MYMKHINTTLLRKYDSFKKIHKSFSNWNWDRPFYERNSEISDRN